MSLVAYLRPINLVPFGVYTRLYQTNQLLHVPMTIVQVLKYPALIYSVISCALIPVTRFWLGPLMESSRRGEVQIPEYYLLAAMFLTLSTIFVTATIGAAKGIVEIHSRVSFFSVVASVFGLAAFAWVIQIYYALFF